MPELPEVETIRRDLETRIVGKPILTIELRLPKIAKNEPDFFIRTLQGHAFSAVNRRGKLLQLPIANTKYTLLVHLKMTGQLLYQHGADITAGGHPWPPFSTELPNKYTHLIFRFSDGGVLYFNDLRQFGFAKIVTPPELEKVLKEYGLEPLDETFTLEHFRSLLGRRTGPLKALLLNQKILSGLGNIYADEVCHFAQVRPDRKISSLKRAEIALLYEGCKTILAESISHRGTTFRDFRDSEGKVGNYAQFLKVYGRAGEPCLRCGGTIEKIRLAGRGTHFCPNCQK